MDNCPRFIFFSIANSNLIISISECEGGSLPTDCAPACPTTCSNDESCVAGPKECEKGVFCVCPPGMVRLNRNLPVQCVLPQECPGNRDDSKTFVV